MGASKFRVGLEGLANLKESHAASDARDSACLARDDSESELVARERHASSRVASLHHRPEQQGRLRSSKQRRHTMKTTNILQTIL